MLACYQRDARTRSLSSEAQRYDYFPEYPRISEIIIRLIRAARPLVAWLVQESVVFNYSFLLVMTGDSPDSPLSCTAAISEPFCP